MSTLNQNRIVTLNCGLGRDSIAMLMLCIEGRLETEEHGLILPEDLDCVVFSNTGCEWPHTYQQIPRVSQMCDDHGIRFIILWKGDDDRDDGPAESWKRIDERASNGGYHTRPRIMDDFMSRATVASLGKGDCTDNHKIQPIRRLINDISHVRFGLTNRRWSYEVRQGDRPPHINLIGIAFDERSRAEGGPDGPYYVEECYPLIDMEIAKEGEAEILDRHGFGDVKKSGCWMCPYQPASWYWALKETQPDVYRSAVEYEAHALARNPRMAATGYKREGRPMTIPEVVDRWRSDNPDATIEAVLSKSYTRCTKEARKKQRAELAGQMTIYDAIGAA